MALTKCKECGHAVSTTAAACPNCGAPDFIPDDVKMAMEKERKQRQLIAVIENYRQNRKQEEERQKEQLKEMIEKQGSRTCLWSSNTRKQSRATQESSDKPTGGDSPAVQKIMAERKAKRKANAYDAKALYLALIITVSCIFIFVMLVAPRLPIWQKGTSSSSIRNTITPTSSSSRRGSSTRNSPLPKYTILDEDIYDTPIKVQVEIDLLVSKDITQEELTVLLKHLYEKNRQRGGFKYHKYPTHFAIRAYTSKEHADSGMGQWVGMLSKIQNDAVELTVKGQLLTKLKQKPKQKFGLTEAKRRSIFTELVKAEDKTWKEAEAKYPNQYLKPEFGDFRNKLEEKYNDELATKHGLTREQLEEIGIEGFVNNWPLPK